MITISDIRLTISGIALLVSTASFAQQDSALNRSVTVERDFQPVIQAAGKVSTKPAIVETTIAIYSAMFLAVIGLSSVP